MESFKYQGRWWLPDNPEKKIAGTLTFSPSTDISLEVLDSFSTEEDQSVPAVIREGFESKTYKIILGVIENGKTVTLWQCQSRNSITVWGTPFEFESHRIEASVAFIGSHFQDETQIMFQEAHVQYTYLSDWASTSGFSWSKHLDLPKLEIHYTRPEDLKISTSLATISLTHSYGLKTSRLEEYKLSQEHWLKINLLNPNSYDDFYNKYLDPIQDLLSFATTKPNKMVSLQFNLTTSTSENNLVDVVFGQRDIEPRPQELLRPHYQLFTLQDVKSDIDKIVENWLKIYQELDNVFSLFFGVKYNSKMYLKQQFLYVIQAVETYHRMRKKNYVLDPEKHKSKLKTILENCGDENKEWLQSILNFSNEPRLRDRLIELLIQTKGALAYLNLNEKNFTKIAKDTRNYFTHYDESLKKKAAKGIKLFRLTHGLSYLLQACILDELGISPEKQKELFERNQTYIQSKYDF
jgi:ApeA N-terminal domain 1